MLSLIVARDWNGAIGKDGDIPWHAPEDLAFFQRETRFGAVVMGRKTWESLPFKPLKQRMNIVVSSNPNCAPEADIVTPSLDAALNAAHAAGHARVYAIGGAGIYAAALPVADRLLITEVEMRIDGADTYFPEFDATQWRQSKPLRLRDEAPVCDMVEYLRN